MIPDICCCKKKTTKNHHQIGDHDSSCPRAFLSLVGPPIIGLLDTNVLEQRRSFSCSISPFLPDLEANQHWLHWWLYLLARDSGRNALRSWNTRSRVPDGHCPSLYLQTRQGLCAIIHNVTRGSLSGQCSTANQDNALDFLKQQDITYRNNIPYCLEENSKIEYFSLYPEREEYPPFFPSRGFLGNGAVSTLSPFTTTISGRSTEDWG